MKTFVYRLYQLLVAAPLIIVATILTAVVTTIGCTVGNGHFWGYWPGRIWAWFICRVLLIPVKVEGREHLEPGTSYVFVANHQGAFDIFLVYGFLNRNFKWMMKQSLRRVPFVGLACKASHQVFVNKTSKSGIANTYSEARNILKSGMSLMVFPEGARTFTGHMGFFRRGAFALADELQLPVVPMTINGSFDILPRTRGVNFVRRCPLTLTIHQPIPPKGNGAEDIRQTMEQSYDAIMAALPEDYQGYVENKDQ